jgi:hypothetical protein
MKQEDLNRKYRQIEQQQQTVLGILLIQLYVDLAKSNNFTTGMTFKV